MKKLLLGIGFASILVLTACNAEGNDDRVLIEVEGISITENEFVNELKERFGDAVITSLVQQKMYEAHADRLNITEEELDAEVAMLREAYGVEDDEDFENFLTMQNFPDEAAFRQVVMQHLVIQKTAAEDIEITDEELRREYEVGKEIEASHILVHDLETAEEILKKLDQGEDFSELAKEFSNDPGSGAAGGSLGYFSRGRMVPEFEAAAFSLEIGQISEPVKSDYGYHIIKVTGQKPFEEAFEEVEDVLKELLARRQARDLEEVQSEIKENATINVKEERYKNLFETE